MESQFKKEYFSTFSSVTWRIDVRPSQDYMESPKFEFNKKNWIFTVDMFNGLKLSLHYDPNQPFIDVFYRFGVRDNCGLVYAAFEGRTQFNEEVRMAGYQFLILDVQFHEVLYEKLLFHERILTVFCELRNGAYAPMEKGGFKNCATLTRNYTDTLAADIGSLLKDRELCDVTLKLENEVFQAHKIILVARSSVFAAMFEHDLKERNSNEVIIEDIRPQDFGIVLDYIYSGNVGELPIEQALGVYFAADKYDLEALKSHCRNTLLKKLSENWFFEIAALAEAHNDKKLMDSVKKFASSNVSPLLSSDKCSEFSRHHPILAEALLLSSTSQVKAKD